MLMRSQIILSLPSSFNSAYIALLLLCHQLLSLVSVEENLKVIVLLLELVDMAELRTISLWHPEAVGSP